LKKNGIALRNPTNGNHSKIDKTKNERGGHTPYGYAYLDGQLLLDPKEQIIVRKILKLHHCRIAFKITRVVAQTDQGGATGDDQATA